MPAPARFRRLLSTATAALIPLVLAACQGIRAEQTATTTVTELPPPERAAQTEAERAEAALAAFVATRGAGPVPHYRQAHADLDADGREDVLMWLDDPNFCDRGGGCTLLVFRNQPAGYTLVGETTSVRPPILVSPNRTQGWRDLLVDVHADGIQGGTVALQSNGQHYPADATLLALLARAPAGHEAIAAE